jgi:rhodanese-related sulfurtransferase
MEGLNETIWTTRDLLERLERCEKFFVLDVRNRNEFGRFRIEGREPLPAVNVPYFEMLELGGKDEMVGSVAAYVERHMASQLERVIDTHGHADHISGGPLSPPKPALPTTSIPTTLSIQSTCFPGPSPTSRFGTARYSR